MKISEVAVFWWERLMAGEVNIGLGLFIITGVRGLHELPGISINIVDSNLRNNT